MSDLKGKWYIFITSGIYLSHMCIVVIIQILCLHISTRDIFYVRREVNLKKTAKVNAYIMHIFGKIEPLSIHAT